MLYKAKTDPDPDIRKSGPRNFIKSGLYAKIYYRGLKPVFGEFEGADFKHDHSLLKL